MPHVLDGTGPVVLQTGCDTCAAATDSSASEDKHLEHKDPCCAHTNGYTAEHDDSATDIREEGRSLPLGSYESAM